ncbi:MAG: efflux RND transporter periplasmic adaptor subunit [Verrucomicrobiaceae bacterium]|nr:efflux RND transporter periplasmic adaptor subunit [Verrucomicrobiaceae bacterium]
MKTTFRILPAATKARPTSRKVFASAILATALLGACGKEETAQQDDYVRSVKVVEIGSSVLERVYEFPGQIQAGQQLDLAFEVPGKLTAIKVKEGDMVKKGDLVATLDTRDYQASLNSAKATLEEAKLERDRNQRLFDQQAGSKESVEKSIRTVQTAQASFDKARKAFEDTSLKAPFSGVVAKVFVDDFQNVSANQDIVVMQDTTTFEAVIDIPETLWVLAKPGLSNEERNKRSRPEIRLTALRGESFPATISETSMLADPKTRTFAVTLAFSPPADLNISPGMTAAAILHWAREAQGGANIFSVPVGAVGFDDAGKAYVWKIDREKMIASRLVVEAGEVSEGMIGISGEIGEGELIAGSGVAQIREGMALKRWQP